MPRGRYQQKQWEDREQAILDALESLSVERGFAAITMDDVADAVGISKATLYQHFESKDAMLVQLMTRHAWQFHAWLESTAGQPPLTRLRDTMRTLMQGTITPLRGILSLGRDDVVPVFQNNPALVSQHQQTLDLLCDIVRKGQAAGQIAPDIAPSVIISAMWALSNVSLNRYEPLAHQIDAPPPETATAQMIALFERSISP